VPDQLAAGGEEVNELLRAHVTGVAFSLSLSRNMIAALIQLDRQLADPRPLKEKLKDPAGSPGQVRSRNGRHLLSMNITSRGSLITRGLVTYRLPPENQQVLEYREHEVWGITPAGRAVIVLLKESGLWDEVAGEVPWAADYQAVHRG
jgi:hypothetical protein